MNITVTEKKNILEITPEGSIDLHSAHLLRKALLDASNHKAQDIRVILSAVEYIDSSGAAILIEGFHAVKGAGKSFLLLSPSTAVMKLLELTRLNAIFNVMSEEK